MAKNMEKRDLFPGALELMILQSLRLKPMHGYGLVKHIQQVSDDLLEIEEGSLYPALQRMLREGLLESETGSLGQGPSHAHLPRHRKRPAPPGAGAFQFQAHVCRNYAGAADGVRTGNEGPVAGSP